MKTLDREENFRNPGGMSFAEYLERKGYDATGVIKSPLLIERLDDGRVFLPTAWIYQWRERLARELASKFSPETAGVLGAALLGTLVVFAPIVWRRANSLNVIGGAALALLVWRPDDLFDPSFQLTFLSVIAIVSLAAPVLRKMESVGSWRPTRETPYPPF